MQAVDLATGQVLELSVDEEDQCEDALLQEPMF